MNIAIDTRKVNDYRLFLRVKELPRYRVAGHVLDVPDEYAAALGLPSGCTADSSYVASPFLFDYQRDIAAMAIQKQKFAVFAQCGLGKSLIMLEFARHASANIGDGHVTLIVSPLMVIRQTIAECQRFYGDSLALQHLTSASLPGWLQSGTGIGIVNYEAIRVGLDSRRVGSLILDESSYLKSMYGKWGQRLIEMGRGVPWKLCLTGTPAPNDRIEYGNHAVFLDAFRTNNAFLSRFFVNRGETGNRWEIKAHAVRAFFRSLSAWCIFVENPATYGWKDNVGKIPPIKVHIHEVPLTEHQLSLVSQMGGDMYGTPGGIVSRAKLSQLAKGTFKGQSVATHKFDFMRQLIDSWPTESTIVWCRFNREQDELERLFPRAASLRGDTPDREREKIIADFQSGRTRILISKPKILGFGLNLQVATRQIFSTLQDSWEEFHQAVKRSNRIGSSLPLNVHLPVTEIERPMIETVLAKAHRIQCDVEEQERLFKTFSHFKRG